jgi:AraC-like DNA-binding protein
VGIVSYLDVVIAQPSHVHRPGLIAGSNRMRCREMRAQPVGSKVRTVPARFAQPAGSGAAARMRPAPSHRIDGPAYRKRIEGIRVSARLGHRTSTGTMDMFTHESSLTSSIQPAATVHLPIVRESALAPFDRLHAGAPRRRKPGLAPHALRRALSYVDDTLDGRLTWEDIAAALDMNHFTLGRAFRASTGMTLHQYVTERRVHRARQLLAQGALSIADVALEVGFSCQSHLTTQFRRYTGTTPAAFRRAAARSDRPLASTVHLAAVQPGRAEQRLALVSIDGPARVSTGSNARAAAIAL